MTELKPQRSGGLCLREDDEGQKALTVELFERFHTMKTYGKDIESLESIVRVFKRDLAGYSTEDIMRAMSWHSRRSAEFPTVADIAGIIERAGKPEIRESDIIAIRKKDGEFRTQAEWNLLHDWEEQQMTGWGSSAEKQLVRHRELEGLRAQIKQLQAQNRELAELLRVERVKKGVEREKPQRQKMIDDTVAMMKATGASPADIEEFLASV